MMRRRSLFAIAVIAVTLLSAATLSAHHSFTATYNTDKTTSIEGTVTQFLLRNPHSFLHVMVKSKDGKEEIWNVEWAAAGQLAGTFVNSLKAGDPVVISGNPARDPADLRIRMVTVKRTSDGASWGFASGQTFK
jgi:hypothetical protein